MIFVKSVMLKKTNFTKTRNWIIANLIDLLGFSLLKVWKILRFSKNSLHSKVKKILIIRTDGIGDVLVTIPLFRSLKKLYPEGEIECLIRPNSKEVLENIPYIRRIIQSFSRRSDIINAIRLRKQEYDVVINPGSDGYFFNHFIAFLVGGKRRVGFAMKGGGFFLTDIVPWNGEKSIIQLLLDISKALGENEENPNIELSIANDEDIYGENLLKDIGISKNDLVIGLNPFASHPFIWPIDRFIKLSEKLVKDFNVKIIFIGDEKSEEKIDGIRKFVSVPTFSLAGRTNFGQLVALIKKFSLLLTVDSAPRHIANAVNTPVIVLRNGANSNVLWGKYSENEHLIYHQAPCSPCGKKSCPESKRVCMTKITPEEVLNCVGKII